MVLPDNPIAAALVKANLQPAEDDLFMVWQICAQLAARDLTPRKLVHKMGADHTHILGEKPLAKGFRFK